MPDDNSPPKQGGVRRFKSSAIRRARRALASIQHAVMFKPKSSDLQKSLAKLSDNKKDLRTRLKHLKLILDHNNPKESKQTLIEDTEEVFGVFVECFQALDLTLKQKGQRINKEDVETVLYSLERILLLLPEFVRTCPPQATVITAVFKRCLHPCSALRLRREAMRPFLVYYQILRELCSEELHHLFALLVPGLTGAVPGEGEREADIFEQAPPLLLPAAGEKPPDNISRLMYETLLDLLVSQVYRISWDNADHYQASFTFLFDRFKASYLSRVFPDARSCLTPVKGFYPAPIEGTTSSANDDKIIPLQVATLKWLITFLQSPDSLRSDYSAESHKKRIRDNSIGNEHADSGFVASRNRDSSGSFSAAVQNFLHFEVTVPGGGIDGKHRATYASNIYLMVRHTLLSSSTNIQLIHELFENAFKLPITEHAVIRRVVAVYDSWISSAEVSKNTNTNGATMETVDAIPRQHQSVIGPNFAADQSTLKVFCGSSVYPFAYELARNEFPPLERAKLLDEQEEICKKIVLLYRFAILKIPMSLSTWECVLNTLIRVTRSLMPTEPPKDRLSVLCGRLAVNLFQTLLVAWVKGTLSAFIAPRLWNDLTKVLSKLTSWDELIVRWEKTLEVITKLFAIEVFRVDSESSSENGLTSAGTYATHQSSDEGTLVADQPRCRSSATSSETEGISVHLFGSTRGDQDSGSIRSGIAEGDEIEGSFQGRESVSTKPADEISIRRNHHTSGEDTDGNLSSSDHFMDTSRSTSTPDSLRESLNSPLFYPLPEIERKRASSSCSWMSVMAGGQLQGWSPDSACALWFRVFGVIGPLNKIQNPVSHKFALESVNRIVDMLHLVQDKRGISSENIKPSVIERFIPVAILAPLLFEVMMLPESYHSSHVLSMEMLCQMVFRSSPIPKNFTLHLYHVLHSVLLSGDFELIEVIFTSCGMMLFCSGIPDAFLLVEDFIAAAQSLTKCKSPELQLKSIRILDSLFFYLSRLPSGFSVFSPIADSFKIKPCHNQEVRTKIYSVLLQYTGVTFPSGVRIPAFHCMGNVLYSVLSAEECNLSTVDLLLVPILQAIENYGGEGVTDVIDVLSMLCNHARRLADILPSAVFRIIEVISNVLKEITAEISGVYDVSREVEEIFIKLTLCLCEWVISFPEIISMQQEGSLENAGALRSLVERTFEGIANMPDTLLTEPDDVNGPNVEVKVKGKRGLSDLLVDRRFSADIGTVVTTRTHAEEDHALTRRATYMFGRPQPVEVVKDKKPSSVRSDVRTQPVFSEGRLRTLKLVGCYASRHISNLFQSVPNPEAWALTRSLMSEEDGFSPGANIADNLQVFALYDLIISMRVILPGEESQIGDPHMNALTSSFSSYPRVRIIIRDIAGKYAYEVQTLFGETDTVDSLYNMVDLFSGISAPSERNKISQSTSGKEEELLDPSIETFEDLVEKHSSDVVLDIMRYIEKTSPDIGLSRDHPWTHPGAPPPGLTVKEEAEAARMMQKQYKTLEECVAEMHKNGHLYAPCARPLPYSVPELAFSYCSRMLSQFGYAGMAKRQHFHLMNRTDEMFRDLNLLDKRPNRDFQKIAVIYIARGQEDKMSIMTNSAGSAAYERFVNRLGWTVNVNEHKGFRGGLPQNSWQFNSAIYFASATQEVVFHVATRVGALSTEDHTAKFEVGRRDRERALEVHD